MLVNHLGYSVSQQHNILVKRLDLSLKLDAVDEINGNWDMLAAQSIEEGVLKKLTFIAHDILRVQNVVVNQHLTTAAYRGHCTSPCCHCETQGIAAIRNDRRR